VVEEDDWVLGLVTLEDLQRPISAGEAQRPLADCRRSDLLWLSAEANLAELEDQLRPNGLRQVPVFRLEDPDLPKLPVGPPSGGLPLAALQGLASRDGMARALARQAGAGSSPTAE
jgi:CBS domain containing-hemolysin-like protein